MSRAFYFVQLIETFPLFNVNFNILGQNFSNQIEIGLQISILKKITWLGMGFFFLCQFFFSLSFHLHVKTRYILIFSCAKRHLLMPYNIPFLFQNPFLLKNWGCLQKAKVLNLKKDRSTAILGWKKIFSRWGLIMWCPNFILITL